MRSGAARAPDLTLVRSGQAPQRQSAPAGAVAPILLFPEPETTTPQPATLLREERLRWLSSLAMVLVIYGGILAWLIYAASTREVIAPPEGAMVVELAMAAGAPPSQPDAPPSPEPVEPTPAPPPEPEPVPEPTPEPEIPPVPEVLDPEVATPPEPEPVIEPEPREEPDAQLPDNQETPVESAPVSTSNSPADASLQDQEAGAPATGASTIDANRASPWRDLLLHRLEQAKRYPYQARRMRQEGVSHLRFTMDRKGQVLSASIDQSSGHKLLDDEVLALIRRIQPLPEPPSEIPGDPVEVVVPVEFFLRR